MVSPLGLREHGVPQRMPPAQASQLLVALPKSQEQPRAQESDASQQAQRPEVSRPQGQDARAVEDEQVQGPEAFFAQP